MVPGLLPTFLHGCAIKSGSGLGTRVIYKNGVFTLTVFLCTCTAWVGKQKAEDTAETSPVWNGDSTCIYIPCTCNQLWNIKEIQNVWVLKKGKAFNHICSEMHVRIYGLIWAKVVTVVYILRLIRNHDLASVGQRPWSYQATGISLLPCM